MSFRSIYNHGFARIAACTPTVTIADPAANAASIKRLVDKAHTEFVALALFTELSLSGYAIDDLLQQRPLLNSVVEHLIELRNYSEQKRTVFVVGAPLVHGGRLYNCAVVIGGGQFLGVVPKTYLPNYREFYERRHFASGAGVGLSEISIGDDKALFGTDVLFRAKNDPNFVFHVEICEDMWTPVPPSSHGALAGATVLLNLSASNITVGKSDARHALCQTQSSRCLAAYVYSAAGVGESTNDLAWDGQAMIYENGDLLIENERFSLDEQMVIADVDLERLSQERMRQVTFGDNADNAGFRNYATVEFVSGSSDRDIGCRRPIERFPFIPTNPAKLHQDCYESYNIQVHALIQRLRTSGIKKAVLGISGGLDSTQALLVVARAFDLLGYPRTDILGFTMPGFATGEKTKGNAWALMKALGISAEEIDIKPACQAMLEVMGHPAGRGEAVYDVTFENIQAGQRTSQLFRLANQRGGMVIGTGDLSESALGWCTYGVGDHMSHYNPNAGVSKKLMQFLIRWVVSEDIFGAVASTVLTSIVNTEISPELVPPGADGKIQSTEDSIGPYELHEFFLHYLTRLGFSPYKVAFLAYQAWGGDNPAPWPANLPDGEKRTYELAEIKKWLRVFVRRFYGFSQFKRTAVPNGPKVSSAGALSPRGDWRAPSDAKATIWIESVEKIPDEF